MIMKTSSGVPVPPAGSLPSAGGRVSRRSLVGGALAGSLALLLHVPRSWLGARAARAQSNADGAPAIDEGERATLTAFSRVLIPSAFAGPGRGAAPVVAAILDDHAADAAFRSAAAFLDGKSAAAYTVPFAGLDPARQRALVQSLLTPATTQSLILNPYYYVSEEGRALRRLWRLVAKPIIADFYASPLGWQVVGYARRPGQCANLSDYQHPIA